MGKATARKTKAAKAEAPLVRAQRELRNLTKEAQGTQDAVRAIKFRTAIEAAKKEVFLLERKEAARGVRGTLETQEQLAAIPADRRQPALARLYERGDLSEDQFRAYQEIESIVEAIQRAVDVRCASIEARVDCARGDRDMLVEGLARIRLEVTYSAWRNTLPIPRRAIIDLIETNRSMAATARVYKLDPRTLEKRVKQALDRWTEIKAETWRTVSKDDVRDIYSKIGCGELLPPKPRKVA